MFLGDLTKPAITIADVDNLLKFGILFAVRRCIVATKFLLKSDIVCRSY